MQKSSLPPRSTWSLIWRNLFAYLLCASTICLSSSTKITSNAFDGSVELENTQIKLNKLNISLTVIKNNNNVERNMLTHIIKGDHYDI
jgi:hypothetical protein